jgi:hypothetical protein
VFKFENATEMIYAISSVRRSGDNKIPAKTVTLISSKLLTRTIAQLYSAMFEMLNATTIWVEVNFNVGVCLELFLSPAGARAVCPQPVYRPASKRASVHRKESQESVLAAHPVVVGLVQTKGTAPRTRCFLVEVTLVLSVHQTSLFSYLHHAGIFDADALVQVPDVQQT